MNNKIFKVLLVVGLSLSLVGCGGSKIEGWSKSKLANKIPEPKFGEGEIAYEVDDAVKIDVNKTSEDDYQGYVDELKENGYDAVILDEYDGYYDAFNSENYKVSLIYQDSSNLLSIYVEDAPELKEITWPTMNVGASIIPVPKSNKGKLKENSIFFEALIADTSETEFNEYVNECMRKGFNIKYDKDDKYFVAYNKFGDELQLDYEKDGDNLMTINVKLSGDIKDRKPVNTSSSSVDGSSNTSSTNNSDKVDPKFKKAMDSYEEFFDEYIAFMKKYNDAGNPTSMLKDYNKYMKKYTKMMSDMEKAKTSDLSTADLAYYTEVHLRITEKLLKIQ